jgi:hypothetical protein
MMKKPLKTPVKPSRRTLFLRSSGSLTLWRRKKPSKMPPAVDYRGIFCQKKYAVKEQNQEIIKKIFSNKNDVVMSLLGNKYSKDIDYPNFSYSVEMNSKIAE